MLKNYLVYLFIILHICTGCSSIKKNNITDVPPVTDTVRDGSSFDAAIIITETRHWQGITAEYAWLEKTYPGYTTVKRFLNYKGKKVFDVNKILTIEGQPVTVYFDISSFIEKE